MVMNSKFGNGTNHLDNSVPKDYADVASLLPVQIILYYILSFSGGMM
jgi:hypothetical protein